ncbi:hypothetical protein FRC12_009312 [Ceratobasidium sp. 428]|nr:hypothetical protein FRC12_009312 [Ceratobasidium sp. 428]
MSHQATAYFNPANQLVKVTVPPEQREFVAHGGGGPTPNQIQGHIKLGEPIQPGQQEQFHVTPNGDTTLIFIGANQFLGE